MNRRALSTINSVIASQVKTLFFLIGIVVYSNSIGQIAQSLVASSTTNTLCYWLSDGLTSSENMQLIKYELNRRGATCPKIYSDTLDPQIKNPPQSVVNQEIEKLKKEVEESRLKQQQLQSQIERQREQASLISTSQSSNKLAPSQTTKSVLALVIGNSSYPKSPLTNPTNDANEFAKKLIQYGFNVKLLIDGDRKSIIRALNEFQSQSTKYDVNILFYAGHGIQYNGVNYLIPIDMSLDAGSASIEFDGISANQVIDKYMHGKTKLVFLDACRDNPLSRSLQIASRGGNFRGLAAMDANSGTLISYSTKDGNVALDGIAKNSPYTEALLKYLDSREDISLILRKVRQSVIDKTGGKQVPWDYGSLVGDQLILSNK